MEKKSTRRAQEFPEREQARAELISDFDLDNVKGCRQQLERLSKDDPRSRFEFPANLTKADVEEDLKKRDIDPKEADALKLAYCYHEGVRRFTFATQSRRSALVRVVAILEGLISPTSIPGIC